MAEAEPVEPSLFGYIDDYIDEADIVSASSSELDADSNLLVFLESFFSQFFQNVLRHEITSISLHSAREANKLLKRNRDWSRERKRLVRQFQHLCKARRDLLGHAYGGGSSEVTEFHFSFMPELLTSIEAWAADEGFAPIAARVRQSRRSYADFLDVNPDALL